MNSVFNIDFRKLAVLLTPTFLRKPLFTALARILAQPLDTLHNTFCDKRDEHLFNLAHNGQVCYLKDALNKTFGITDYSAGFQIRDIDAIGNYIIAYDEAQWLIDTDRVWLAQNSPQYDIVYDTQTISTATHAFIVLLPQPFTASDGKPDNAQIAAIVEQYRLVSRTPTYQQQNQ